MHYYGRRHDYIYYPIAWVDASTGRSYQAGYYDEDGTRYDNVSFEENGKYKNVVCHCEYCGQDTVMDLSAQDAAGTELKCPSCGGPILVKSFLDQEMQDTGRSAAPGKTGRKRGVGCLVVLAFFLIVGAIGSLFPGRSTTTTPPAAVQEILPAAEAPAVETAERDRVYLALRSDNAYTVVDESDLWDKELVWDEAAEGYYDEATEGWAWYNTDMYPAVWQYWYEGISSDYGDYGWMEHDETGWYIEASEGDWIPLPDVYDTSRLWYIEEN